MIDRYSARLKNDPNDAEAFHYRGLAFYQLQRFSDAIDDLTAAIHLRPDDALAWYHRALAYRRQNRFELAIPDLEAALARDPDRAMFRDGLADSYLHLAGQMDKGLETTRERALTLARRALDLKPGEADFLNALGVAEYRAGHYSQAIATLGRSLEASHSQYVAAFNLFFMAMSHHRLGHSEQARDCYKRAGRSLPEQIDPLSINDRKLATIRTEAEAVLTGPAGELPINVFAPSIEQPRANRR